MSVAPIPLTWPASVSIEIVDGNVKMTLGMIWTIILRFAIQDISVEGGFLLRSVPLPFLPHLPSSPGSSGTPPPGAVAMISDNSPKICYPSSIPHFQEVKAAVVKYLKASLGPQWERINHRQVS